jgi:hypothetical protein
VLSFISTNEKSIVMNINDHEISRILIEINQEKLRVKEAIKNGAIFEEVKKMTLHIKELQQKLESCLAIQQDTIRN